MINCITIKNKFNSEQTLDAPSDDWSAWNERFQERPAVTYPEGAIEKLQSICGTLVIHPLDFWKNEKKIESFKDLLSNPSLAVTKEGIAQWLNGSLFE